MKIVRVDLGLGAVLRHARERRGLSLRELAVLANTDHAYIHRIERGDKEPSLEMLVRLLKPLRPTPGDKALLLLAGFKVSP